MNSVDLIERYFDNDLSASELRDFQRRLETDAEFAQAFQLEKDLMEGIEVMGNQNLKKELKGIYEEEIGGKAQKSAPAKPVLFSRRSWMAVAASIAVLLIAGWWLSRPPTPEKLYAQYFKPDFDFVEKGGGEKLVAEAEAALERGDYEGALPLLEELLKEKPINGRYLLAKGIALVETEKYMEGIDAFLTLENSSRYTRSEALWYHGLALLKQGHLTESYIILKQIPENSSRYKEAEELAKKIRN